MLFEGTPERPWRDGEKRVSRMVFIGRELDKETFQEVGSSRREAACFPRARLYRFPPPPWLPSSCHMPVGKFAHPHPFSLRAQTHTHTHTQIHTFSHPQVFNNCLADVEKMPSGMTYEQRDEFLAEQAGAKA